MEKAVKRRYFYSDVRGFSTVFDVFLFLLMVSICAVILLPALMGNIQVRSALESKSQKQSSEILLTLLNGRVDEFEYTVAGEQMDAIAGDFNNSPIYKAGKKLIAGKELKHRTFADLAAENVASQWVIYNSGTRIQLNFLMTDYKTRSDSVLKNYLDSQIGDRYNYNFTVVWLPFVNVPIGGDVSFGKPVPENTYTESAYITMPYHVNFTRKQVEELIDAKFNESIFGNLSSMLDELKKNGTNRTAIEDELSNKINDVINDTIDENVNIIVDESLGNILDDGKDAMIEQVNNLLPESDILLNQEINDKINATLESVGADIESTVTDTLKSYLSSTAKQEVNEIANDEIKKLAAEIADMYMDNKMTISEVKDRILTEVFSRISISRARATLAIWEKRS